MRRTNVLVLRENAAHRTQMLSEIGRRLRDGYDAAQPLPDRLADLVRQLSRVRDPLD